MTKQVTFYTHVQDKQYFVCRLLKTIYLKKVHVLVVLPTEQDLYDLDQALWAYQDNSFLAHDIWQAGECFPTESPIVLMQYFSDWEQEPVFVQTALNLSHKILEHQYINRVLEVIGIDETELNQARKRFSLYRQLQYQIEHHKMI